MDSITLYTVIYYLSMILPLAGYLYLHISQKEKPTIQVNIFFIVYILFIVLMIGFRPIGESGFNDTPMYIGQFEESQKGTVYKQDIGFDVFQFLIAKFADIRSFFVISTLFSFGLLYYNSRKLMKENWAILFFGFMISLFFWNHQAFTIRQGLATMLFLTGLNSKIWKNRIFFFILAISFHKYLLIPVLCIFPTIWIKNTKWYLFLWGVCLLISPFMGDVLQALLINFNENRVVEHYFQTIFQDEKAYVIRWDFVIYSLIFIFLGLYHKQNTMKNNHFYHQILNFYILSNAIILLITPFVDGHLHRFSYASIFVIPILLFLPIIHEKEKIYKKYLTYFIPYYIMILLYIGHKIITQEGSYL